MARPKKEIDLNQLKAFMRMKPTLKDTAAFFDVSDRTIERLVLENWNLSYVEFRDQNMVHTRYSIVRKAIEKAEAGDNCMLIFCLKNLCGWKDRYESDVQHTIKPAVVQKLNGAEVVFTGAQQPTSEGLNG